MTHSTTSRVWRWLVPLGVLMLLSLSTLACGVGLGGSDELRLDRTYRLKSGDQRTGDQVVMAYDADLEAHSVVTGNVTVTANRVDLDAEVDGDVVVVANTLDIGASAHVTGDVVACVHTLKYDGDARIEGELRRECADDDSVSVTEIVDSGWDIWRGSVFFRLSTVLMGMLLFGALAALGTVLIPRRLVRMSESVQQAPLTAGGMGLLTLVVAVGLTLIYGLSLRLVVPLVLLPVVILAWVVLIVLSLIGWVALAAPFGVFFFRLVRVDTLPRMITAAVGGMVLALLLRVWSVFWVTSWIGLLVSLVVGSVGL
ncbi:MAG: polymer-forming cytoskeletal protein, partial [Anaerolineae bacterium]|nr:polymer-forming cytoskeletal protein [Anaerolineae bacterium]